MSCSINCKVSEDLKLVAADPIPQRFLNRLNCIPVSDIRDRILAAHKRLAGFCTVVVPPNDGEAGSSSSSCCPIYHPPTIEVSEVTLITIDDIDAETLELLQMLENEACDTIRSMNNLEKLIALGACPSSSSEQPSISNPPTSSECCEGPLRIAMDCGGNETVIYDNFNGTVYTPYQADSCNFFTSPISIIVGDQIFPGFLFYFYDTLLNQWVLHEYNTEDPFNSRLIGTETTGSSKCDFDGEITTETGVCVIVPYEPHSSSQSSSESSSSSSGECATTGMEIYCDCPRFAHLTGMVLLPGPGTQFMYGDCEFTSSSSSSSSSSSGSSSSSSSSGSSSSSDIPSSSSGEAASRSGTLAYNVGGYWELQNNEAGLIGILVTNNSKNPEGEYQFVAEGCDGTQLTVRPVT